MDTSHFPVGSNIAWTENNRIHFSTAKVISIVSDTILHIKWDHWADEDGLGTLDLSKDALPHLLKD